MLFGVILQSLNRQGPYSRLFVKLTENLSDRKKLLTIRYGTEGDKLYSDHAVMSRFINHSVNFFS